MTRKEKDAASVAAMAASGIAPTIYQVERVALLAPFPLSFAYLSRLFSEAIQEPRAVPADL